MSSTSQEVSRCPFCGGERLAVAYAGVQDRLRMSQVTWDWVRCRHCGSLVLSPRPPAEELAAFYPPAYAAPAETAGSGAATRGVHALEELLFALQSRGQTRIVSRLTGLAAGGADVLDVGCGGGRQLRQFRRMGLRVRGVDMRPEAAERVRRLGIPADVCSAEALTDVVEPASVDLVTGFALLEHADDVRRLLESFREALRPGGWIALEVPVTPSCDERVLGPRWRVLTEAPRHTTVPSPMGLATLLRDVGFADLRAAPDPVIVLGAVFALSVVPDVDATLVWSRGGASAVLRRLSGGLAVAPATLWGAWTAWVARRPSIVIVAARKAGGG